jgi:opacity protein-like surface antigen
MTLRQSFAGAFAFFALASAAQAADMQPVLKAPPPSPAAEQQATGYVEVYGGWASTKLSENECSYGRCYPDSARANGWVLGGAGRGNYWVSRDMSLQFDAQAEGTSYDADRISDGRVSAHSFLIGGHWSWRNPQQYLFGLFAAAGDAGGALAPAQRHALIGGEAQWYWNQFTLYVQGGYDTTLGNVDSEIDSMNAWFVRGTGRYFVNPNFLLEGTFMYASGSIDFNSSLPSRDFQTWVWQAKAEWRLPTAPFSLFAKYQYSETKYDTLSFREESIDSKTRDYRVLLGLKLHMGDKTLQQTDRAGATLDIVSPLANPTSPVMLPNFDVIRSVPDLR